MQFVDFDKLTQFIPNMENKLKLSLNCKKYLFPLKVNIFFFQNQQIKYNDLLIFSTSNQNMHNFICETISA